MIGRGLIAKPGMLSELDEEAQRCVFRAFHDDLFHGYEGYLSGERNVLFKMKELWSYWIKQFPQEEKAFKQIKKCNSCKEYEIIVKNMLQS
jgi:tRNA-dihydrouridine synthase